MAKTQVGVIGLGKFGFKFGQTLIKHGLEVVGIDQDPENVKRSQHLFTQVYVADAMDKQVLQQLGLADLPHVLVSVGDSIAASSMIAMYLKEMGVPTVWVKAINSEHEKLLLKVGADEVIIPEHLAAQQMASRIAIPGLIERLPFGPNMAIKEVQIEKWAGQSLREINLTNRLRVQAVAIKKHGESDFQFIPQADDPLGKGDILILIGPIATLADIEA